jgi:hypothetical protein
MKAFENHFDWYRLGLIHRLLSFHDGDLVKRHAYSIFQCMIQLTVFLQEPLNQQRLPGSVKAAIALEERLRGLINAQMDDTETTISVASFYHNSLHEFETLLKHESANLNTFILEDVGIFHVNKLMDDADRHLSEVAQQVIEDRTKIDFKAAGRCLAFDLFTASGFHSVRAVEAVVRAYYKKLTGLDADAGSGGTPLGPMINAFRTERDRRELPKDSPLDLAIANLTLLNNIYRKPLGHPQMMLDSRDDAKKVFDLATVLINFVAEQILALS